MNVLLLFSILALILALGVCVAHIVTLQKKVDELNQHNSTLHTQHETFHNIETELKNEINLLNSKEKTLTVEKKELENIIAQCEETVHNVQSSLLEKEELLNAANTEREYILAQHTFELQQCNTALHDKNSSIAALETALKENEQYLYSIIEKSPVPACMVNTNGIFEVVNDSLCHLTSRTSVELLHQHFALLISEEKKKETFAAWNTLLAGTEDFQREVEWITPNGDHKIVTLQIIYCANVRGERKIIAFAFDVSQQRKAAEDIQQALEREKELRELKSNFVSTVSHELRTPLTTILSNAELLERFSAKWDDEKRNRALHRILESISQMMELLNDVLFIGKIDAGKIEYTPVPLDLSILCQDINDEIFNSSIGAHHKLQFAIQGNTTDIPVDPKLLRNAINNVLNNAVKYSAAGSTISCMVQCTDTDAVITVHDDGIGILPSDRKKLFSVFHRGANVGTTPGTGLGLAIVKYCIEMHGGTVGIESEVEKGTTVRMTFPLLLSNSQKQ